MAFKPECYRLTLLGYRRVKDRAREATVWGGLHWGGWSLASAGQGNRIYGGRTAAGPAVDGRREVRRNGRERVRRHGSTQRAPLNWAPAVVVVKAELRGQAVEITREERCLA